VGAAPVATKVASEQARRDLLGFTRCIIHRTIVDKNVLYTMPVSHTLSHDTINIYTPSSLHR
jgi:hypothetical protein